MARPSAGEAPGVRAAAPADGIEIRPLRSHDELQACLALQRETWGDAPGTLVPTPLLLVVQRIGGVSAGAFDRDGRLLGFVFGMTGVERGMLVHWSDMLAVRPEARDRGVGRRLKEYQRDAVIPLGVRRIYWTFDPLVAKNAYFNLDMLGGQVWEYVPDMYGDTGSPMHEGLGTDRIIVAWLIGDEPDEPDEPDDPDERRPGGSQRGRRGRRARRGAAEDRSQRASTYRSAPVLNPDGAEFEFSGYAAERVRIEIPLDIFDVRARSVDVARRWRESSRAAFRWALEQGYDVEGVERDREDGRAYYLLSRVP